MAFSHFLFLCEDDRLSGPPLPSFLQRPEWHMGFRLIPVGHGRHIVLPLEQAPVGNANLLDCHTDILVKQNRVRDVPPVKASLRHHVVIVIVVMDFRIMPGVIGVTQIGCAEGILHGFSVFAGGKAPGAAKVILRPVPHIVGYSSSPSR